MKPNKKRSILFIFLVLFFGVIAGSALSQFIAAFFPASLPIPDHISDHA